MAVTLRYFTEFGKHALQKTIMAQLMQDSIVFLVRVQCRREESSRSLSHLLMSFLSVMLTPSANVFTYLFPYNLLNSIGLRTDYCSSRAVQAALWTPLHTASSNKRHNPGKNCARKF